LTKLVVIEAAKMEKLLLKLGFEKSGRSLARPLIREVLREIDLGIEEYNRLLEEL
jgi:hypothetical protein